MSIVEKNSNHSACQVSMGALGVAQHTGDEEYSIINVGPSRPPPAQMKAEREKKQRDEVRKIDRIRCGLSVAQEERKRAETERLAKEKEATAQKKPKTLRQKHKMEKVRRGWE